MNGTNSTLEGSVDQIEEKFWLGPVICLGGIVGSMPVRRAETWI